AMVEKKGFTSYSEAVAEDLFFTYFFKVSEVGDGTERDPLQAGEDWEELSDRYRGGTVSVDVRDLPMPQPMVRILEALEALPVGQALFVEHKKIPVFLLPELRERGFDYRIKEIENQHVQLLIFRLDESN